jgi:hypothetical protein
MHWRPAHDSEATDHSVRAGFVVRLRLSAAELLWRVARWGARVGRCRGGGGAFPLVVTVSLTD